MSLHKSEQIRRQRHTDPGTVSGALYTRRDAEQRGRVALSALPTVFAGGQNARSVVTARHTGHPLQALLRSFDDGARSVWAARCQTDDGGHISAHRFRYDAASGAAK